MNSISEAGRKPRIAAAASPSPGQGRGVHEPLSRLAVKYGLGMAVVSIPLILLRDNNYWVNILTYTYLMAALASAWNIIGGFGGQFSMGHGVFFGVSAYITAQAYLKAGWSPWLTLPVSAILVAGLAVLISWPTFRLRGPFFAIATMAFNEVAAIIANYAEKLTGGAEGLLIPFRAGLANMIFAERWKYTVMMFVFLALVVALAGLIRRSRLGYYLIAVRDNEDAARAAGIHVLGVKLSGMAISAALTAAGGTLFTMYIRFIDPPSLFSLPEVGVKFALLSLIGGIGTISGPILGAALLVPLENYLRAALGGLPGAHLVVLGLLLMLGALFLKRGIVGTLAARWKK